MDSLYLLLPMSVLLILAVIGIFAWALSAGQFDDLNREGWRVLEAGESEAQPPAAGPAGPVAPDPQLQQSTQTRHVTPNFTHVR